MKMRLKWFVIPAFAVGLVSCKKEAPATKSDTPAAEVAAVKEAVAAVQEKVEAIVKPAVSADERAAKLGFAKYLPANIESLTSVYGAAKIGERAKSLKLWKFIEDEMGGEAATDEDVQDAAKIADPAGAPAQATDPAEAPAKEEAAVPATGTQDLKAPELKEDPAAFTPKDMWGSEVTIALGDHSGEQIAQLLKLVQRYNYFHTRQVTKTMIAQVKKGGEGGMEELENPFSEQLINDLINDPEGGANLFEKMALPPIYIALKVDPAKKEQAAQQISSSLGLIGSFGDFAEAVEVDKGGSKFAGYKVSGAKLSELLVSDRAEMEKTIDADVIDRLIASLSKKNLVILTGTIGDYVVLFLGGSTDQLVFATDAKDSLAGSAALSFVDPFLSKDLAALVFGEKEALKQLVDTAGGISDMAKGLRDGLAGEDGLGDTREIESLLQVVVDRETALRKLSRTDASGTVAFFEEGLKIESFGGVDNGSIDWKAPAKFSHLGDSKDVVLFADVTVDAAYQKASRDFIESLFETGYAITKKASELPGNDENFVQFKQGLKLFDEKFRVDALGLWDAFGNDFHDGLGRESALVVDLKGAVPAIPGLPQAVVDQGKFPRASVIAQVVDRSKLASAWDKANKNSTSILAKISEISGQDIPMQKPLSSEKNGFITWFFPMPFFNDDFLPSLTVSDQWFVASTSKNQALELAGQASKGAEGKKGLVFKINFVALQGYSKEMLKVVDANADSLFAGNIEEYKTNKISIEKGIEALDDFDSLSVYSNRDADYVRTSVHFKTR